MIILYPKVNNKSKSKEKLLYRCKVKRYILPLFLVVFLFGITGAARAAPSITGWSSTGGTTQNKDNAADIMYLVQQGDVITFNVTVTGTEPITYEWQVNKVVDVSATTNTFIWTVPNEKGIWEIHLKVSNADGEDHIEWVISTLNSLEAPGIFDYFTDEKTTGRTETDPWGRPLPEWNLSQGGFDASNGYLNPTNDYNKLYLNVSNITHGTWKFSFRLPEGDGKSYAEVFPIMNETGNYENKHMRLIFGDGYAWFWLKTTLEPPMEGRIPLWGNTFYMSGLFEYYIDNQTAITGIGRNWHNVTLIRDEDGYWMAWMSGRPEDRDGDYMSWSYRWVDGEDIQTSNAIGIYLVKGSVPVYLDNIEVYKDVYLYPQASAVYNSETNEIIISGWDNTLQSISDAIGDESLFIYHPSSKTAYTNVNLTLDKGSKLSIENEKLYFNSSASNRLHFRVKNGAHLIIQNSTVGNSVDGEYFSWAFTGRVYDNKDGFGKDIECDGGGRTGKDYYAYRGKLIIQNSTISDFSNFDFGDAWYLKLKNVVFNNIYSPSNHVGFSINSAVYRHFGEVQNLTLNFKPEGGGVPLYWRQGDAHLSIRDIKISGAPITRICLNSPTYWTNWDFSNANIQWSIYDYDNRKLIPQYYLDVLVQDENGNPVPDATVTVTNEVDDVNYPSENLHEDWRWVPACEIWSGPCSGNGLNAVQYWYDANDFRSTKTGSDGHTPLPIGNESTTLVVADYWKKNATVEQRFTYSITAEKDGNSVTVTGIDPDETWYRPDPNVPTKTITIVLPLNVSTGTLTGKVTDKDTGLPIEGAVIKADSYSATTNSSGDYTISNLPVGDYTVSAEKEGYSSSSASATIIANQTTTLNFQLLAEDTIPPEISNVNATSITPTTAVITWETDEKATSLVEYGTSSGSYPYSKEDTSYTTSHSITLTDLQPNTTYYFVVNSKDEAENPAQSTEHSFNTPALPTTKGDINGDGKVNSLDYSLLVAKWFKTTDIAQEDLNKDGIVNVRDLGILMSNWKE